MPPPSPVTRKKRFLDNSIISLLLEVKGQWYVCRGRGGEGHLYGCKQLVNPTPHNPVK